MQIVDCKKKKITKSVGGELQADERLAAGVFVQPAGALGRSLGSQFGGIAGLVAVTRNHGKKRDAMEIKIDTGIGAQLGDKRHVIGLTSKRFLIWGHSTMSGEPAASTFLTS